MSKIHVYILVYEIYNQIKLNFAGVFACINVNLWIACTTRNYSHCKKVCNPSSKHMATG
jgi:hypothetical protein